MSDNERFQTVNRIHMQHLLDLKAVHTLFTKVSFAKKYAKRKT
jgi:hypothetical protein